MPRGKKIIIEKEIEDKMVDSYKSIDLDEIKKERDYVESSLSNSVANVYKISQQLTYLLRLLLTLKMLVRLN